jgi:hypothetical protein
MPGLDPGIHTDCQHALNVIMDRRVKPGEDKIIGHVFGDL